MIYLDTHVVLWLHDGDVSRISSRAMRRIAAGDNLISPAVVLELELLHEIGRLQTRAAPIISRLSGDTGLRVCELPFPLIVQAALEQKWVRDPFDRLIVAHAHAAKADLMTKDDRIRQNYRRSVW